MRFEWRSTSRHLAIVAVSLGELELLQGQSMIEQLIVYRYELLRPDSLGKIQ